jgi:enoyl-CoA hydratase/carnithine racemase
MGATLMDEAPLVTTEIDPVAGVARVCLNRPEKKNALSIKLIRELNASITALRDESRVHCILLDGAGDSFCSGRDLKDLRESYQGKPRFGDDRDVVMGVVRALREAPQITIACVEGYCLGGGLVLLNGCDIAIVAEDAKLGMPEILRGSYGRSATPTLFHARVPIKHAFFMQLTGKNISGVEAVRMGLASQAVPARDLRDCVSTLAREIATRDPAALEHAKAAAYSSLDLPFFMASRFDEAISYRQRVFTNPVGDVENYLRSQKGGTNTAYRANGESRD